ncbi:Periodic tryptophan protein 2 -like protein [Trichinella pseudospiralis]|uniref:Periodic tryptophan protein 2-like protein n=1 Tax=Trichinella pseudospiralis TaxID=6337 RepID=A0A0V1JBR5_TRIPS|nr:Periodic tryptophan protein 2 -like protein [Trichinella pseudospiralis]
MKLNFKFSNLIGAIYRKGNIVFSNDGDSVYSPVGNRVTIYNLKSHKSETLPVETTRNVNIVALRPTEADLLLVDEAGFGFYVSLVSKMVIHRHTFGKALSAAKFSPDGRYFAVCRDMDVQVFRAPGIVAMSYNPFYVEKTHHIAQDKITCLEWSDDSKFFVVGSKDLQTRVCSVDYRLRPVVCNLSGHSHPIVHCFFDNYNYDIFTVDIYGFVVYWKCEQDLNEVVFKREKQLKLKANGVNNESNMNKKMKIYKIVKKFHIDASSKRGASGILLTSACYHKQTKILVTGHSNGVIILHELPEFYLIHNLCVSEFPIDSVSINNSGDWIAVASSRLGQMLVWEWQSKTYVMKQQGHLHNMTCLTYSPDGSIIASGGHDGKVKLWNVNSGFCFKTLDEHSGGITGIVWTQAGKSVISCSLDGTVRAFDLKRYRNFRTFVSPEPVQFSCLCADFDGEILCAAGQDVFSIYVWSIKTGHLHDVISGHEAPVSGLSFASGCTALASSSWDKTLRIWNILDEKCGREVFNLPTEGLMDVKFSPNGKFVACCCTDCQIVVFDWRAGIQICSIEGRLDLEPLRSDSTVLTAEKLAPTRFYTTLCFSPDGQFIFAAGKSPFVCIYHLKQQLIMKKFKITSNQSIDYVDDYLDKRKLSEFGNLALVDMGDDDMNLENCGKINLPGCRISDPGVRSFKPEFYISKIEMSPTARAWAACSNEGLLIYSLDNVVDFDPFLLDVDVLPEKCKELLGKKEFSEALMMAIKINQSQLIAECLESIPVEEIELICRALPSLYAEKLMYFLGSGILQETTRVEFYLNWVRYLCRHHAMAMKSQMNASLSTVTALQQSVNLLRKNLSRICSSNCYTLKYLLDVHNQATDVKVKEEEKQSANNENMNIDDDDDDHILIERADNG